MGMACPWLHAKTDGLALARCTRGSIRIDPFARQGAISAGAGSHQAGSKAAARCVTVRARQRFRNVHMGHAATCPRLLRSRN